MQIPTKADWVEWKQSPTTLFFLEALKRKREAVKEGLVEEKFEDFTKHVGYAQALKDAMLYALQDFQYQEKDYEENA